MTTLMGGQTIYGAPIGILMLETRFPRPVGDVGNAKTFNFPVLYHVVPNATPTRVVEQRAAGLLAHFVEGGSALVRQGARAIATSCGFLAAHQRALAAEIAAPVATSSLLQIPMILPLLRPNQVVGVLTMSAAALSPDHFAAVGVNTDRVVVRGFDGSPSLYQPIMTNAVELDLAAARAEVVQAARELVVAEPGVGAFVFECTNLCPYAADVMAATGRPVFDVVTLINWLHGAVAPARYPPGL